MRSLRTTIIVLLTFGLVAGSSFGCTTWRAARLYQSGSHALEAGEVERALDDHELVKVRLREPEDKKASARDLAERCGAELCGLVGHTVILYRRHPERPRIELPEREG